VSVVLFVERFLVCAAEEEDQLPPGAHYDATSGLTVAADGTPAVTALRVADAEGRHRQGRDSSVPRRAVATSPTSDETRQRPERDDQLAVSGGAAGPGYAKQLPHRDRDAASALRRGATGPSYDETRAQRDRPQAIPSE
jgi:hypothetical protein